MKIVIISDTHAAHQDLGVLQGDVLIHCGDFEHAFANHDSVLDRVDAWFARQTFQLILCTGGNHDFALQARTRRGARPFRHAHYLQDSGVTFGGLHFYGTPWVPKLPNFAFYADDAALAAAWARIPDDVDVLITHTPPLGVLDVSSRGQALGCAHLALRLKELRPRLHCFGHVHAGAGRQVIGGLTYVNAACVDRNLEIVNPPVVVQMDPNAEKDGG